MSETPWETVIGLEVHVQLKTRTKLFSACPVASGPTDLLSPNTWVDPVSAGLPGALPVPNAEAVRLALRLGLALGAQIDRASIFARKHYFYPDLPRGYQISQFTNPICTGGSLTITTPPGARAIPLIRAHLEEDAGKTIHDPRRAESRVDLNRAGTPLLEIVSEPALRSADEAVAYLRELHRLVTWLGVSDGNLEEGNFRCDANVSVRRLGDPQLGTRTEIKNVNSFRFVHAAIESEKRRHIELLEAGQRVRQETRGWDEARGHTRPLRSKEDAVDYRYLPDPDLLPALISDALWDAESAALPELPRACEARFADLVSREDALVLTQDRARALWFDAVIQAGAHPQTAANWLINDLLGALAKRDPASHAPGLIIAPKQFALLIQGVTANTLSSRMMKDALQAALDQGPSFDAAAWIDAHGGQLADEAALRALVLPLLDKFPSQVAEFRAGKDRLFGFFVGQAMKLTQGRADPDALQRVVRSLLERGAP